MSCASRCPLEGVVEDVVEGVVEGGADNAAFLVSHRVRRTDTRPSLGVKRSESMFTRFSVTCFVGEYRVSI